MSRFVTERKISEFPRLPLEGELDLTYRCNNDCRHCWLNIPADSPLGREELTTAEIFRIVDDARSAGCRRWTISGGESMLRPDFTAIIEHVASRAVAYTLITNGTLITPEIAGLLKRRPGRVLVSVYGYTADVHDHVTGRPGSFEAMKRGLALLKEAGVGFTVQIVPMRSNYHQYEAMKGLASGLSPDWRLGAAWLYRSASGDAEKNRRINGERLAPAEMAKLDPPEVPTIDEPGNEKACSRAASEYLYAECIAGRRSFHVDPYGKMSFCCFVKDPALRCDLRKVPFAEAWDELIPAMARMIRPNEGYKCGTCELRPDCRWCPVYGYLERRDHSARVECLCEAAGAVRKLQEEWRATHRRHYRIADITVQIDSDLPIEKGTYKPKFDLFRADGPGPRNIEIHHHFSLPDTEGKDLGRLIYRHPPWAIYRKDKAWIYAGIQPEGQEGGLHRVIIFNDGHTRAHVFHPSTELYRQGGHDSLMMVSSDQMFLARALPRWDAVFVHGASAIINGKGLVFLGQSGAGKSTMVNMLADKLAGRVEILCDDRSIIARREDGFHLYGSWSHGDVPTVSPNGAPLAAVFFLRQSTDNRLEKLASSQALLAGLLARFARPLLSADWWDEVLGLADGLVTHVPFYDLHFDRSGEICSKLEGFAR